MFKKEGAYKPVRGSLLNKVKGVCDKAKSVFEGALKTVGDHLKTGAKFIDKNLDKIAQGALITGAIALTAAATVATLGAMPVIMASILGSTFIVSASTVATYLGLTAKIAGVVGIISSLLNTTTGAIGYNIAFEKLENNERINRVISGTVGVLTNAINAYYGSMIYSSNKTQNSLTGIYKNNVKPNNVSNNLKLNDKIEEEIVVQNDSKQIQEEIVVVKEDTKRPTFKESENYLYEKENIPESDRQIVYLDSEKTKNNARVKGSSIPEATVKDRNASYEIKNYDINQNSSNLIRNIVGQYEKRLVNLPKGMIQNIYIDVKGQEYTEEMLEVIKNKILEKVSDKTQIKIDFYR